jgi:hypothetical protein
MPCPAIHRSTPFDHASYEETTIAMSATLQETLLAPDTRPKVMTDCYALIEQELSEKSGVSGTAVKLAYKTVTSFAPGYFQNTVEDIFPQMVVKLEPFWAGFRGSGGSEFGDYLAKRGDEVSDAMLSVTDAMAEASERPAIIKAYRAVRGGAAKHVQAALPRVGDLVVKYAG